MDDGAKASNGRAKETAATAADDMSIAAEVADEIADDVAADVMVDVMADPVADPDDVFADAPVWARGSQRQTEASPQQGSSAVTAAPFASRVSVAGRSAGGSRRAFTAYAASVAAARGDLHDPSPAGEIGARGSYPRLLALAGRVAQRGLEGARQARSRWLPATGPRSRRAGSLRGETVAQDAVIDETPIWQIIDPEDPEPPRIDALAAEDAVNASQRRDASAEEAHDLFSLEENDVIEPHREAFEPARGEAITERSNGASALSPRRRVVAGRDSEAAALAPASASPGVFARLWERAVWMRIGMATAVVAATALVITGPRDPWTADPWTVDSWSADQWRGGDESFFGGLFEGGFGDAPPGTDQSSRHVALATSGPNGAPDSGPNSGLGAARTEEDVFALAALRRAALDAARWEARRQGVVGTPRSVSLGASYGAEGFFFGDVVFEEQGGFCSYRRVAFQRAPGAPLDTITVLQIGQPTLGGCAAIDAPGQSDGASSGARIAFSGDGASAETGLPAVVRAAAADATLVSENGYLTEASLRAMISVLPVKCVPSRLVEDACLETVRYDPTAFLFTAITPVAESARLEIEGAYTIRDDAICHETRGVSALVTGGVLSDQEVFAYERLAEADYAAVRGGAICYRFRPAPGAPGVFFGDAFVDGEPAPDWRDPRPFEMRRG